MNTVAVMRWHRRLLWLAASALLMWGLSGLIHVYVSSFGVQQKVFAPPSRSLNLEGTLPIGQILERASISQAAAMRVVVGEHENLLQVTEQQNQPRRYFRLRNGEELDQQDAMQAAFLARHYMNFPSDPVARVQFIQSFSAEYPAVNRLLPVYKVSFATADNLHLYIYTETGAVAGVFNQEKQILQNIFQWLHTGSYWPKPLEWVRVGLFSVWVGALFLMACTGVFLLVRIRRKQRVAGAKGMHRQAAYGLALPVLALSFSGVFHLWQNANEPASTHLRLQTPMPLQGLQYPLGDHWRGLQTNKAFAGMSLVWSSKAGWLHRITLAKPQSGAPIKPAAIRAARFDGVSAMAEPLYLRADNGEIWPEGDLELAHELAERFSGQSRATVQKVERVSRFGGDYDFRNKRLPVWRFEYGEPLNASLFIDTATGVLADAASHHARAERWSFSVLHKWTFLSALGRDIQNAIIAGLMLSILMITVGTGLRMRLKNRHKKV